jgi:hypothetical protein
VLSGNVKIEIYKTIILPVVLYGCETWLVFGKRVARRKIVNEENNRRLKAPPPPPSPSSSSSSFYSSYTSFGGLLPLTCSHSELN